MASTDTRKDEVFHNPSAADPAYHDLDSRIALAGHPIHAMLVAFPIAGTFALAFCDVAFWWTGDLFWARAALWASGGGFAMGCLAALAGAAELLLVPGVRRRAAAWSHAVAAMVLLGVMAASWSLRLQQGADAILPWGLILSWMALGLVGIAGWHGGKLVFEHQVGVSLPEEEDPALPPSDTSGNSAP
ncbi:DUF2231 domain-containing protein [Glycocaulis abyssi]|uniref:DUF2231 domain-containing protein n=1 Tax=Glycocaulis abyssi TaxID=1433403 RepID=A0ABV9NH87_9PROT